MILVKKRSLFILTVLFCVLIILGEVKFFNAVKSINMHTDMDLKYELENFIFAAIVLILVVFFFFINFIRVSNNILKRLDKMVEISEFGKQDVTQHLNKMGGIGKRVKYLLFHLNSLNKMKSLKISSLNCLNDILIERSDEEILLLDCLGRILTCSEMFLDDIGSEKKVIKEKNIKDIFSRLDFENIYNELENNYEKVIDAEAGMSTKDGEKVKKISFLPVMNSNDQVANILCIVKR